MENIRLLNPKNNTSILKIEGNAYIKDSNGQHANLEFITMISLNTETNETVVKYGVCAFYPKSPDYVNIISDNYTEMINKYNELVVKFNGYK